MPELLRFHWSLSQVGQPFRRANDLSRQSGAVSLDPLIEFCQRAEHCGIDSMLMAIGSARPDPMLLSTALGMHIQKMKFMVACRSGLISPAYLVQQVNTLSALTGGRVHVNFVSGHTPHELHYYGDFLSHDERYARTAEFISVCRAFWANEEVTFEGRFYRVAAGRIKTPFVSPTRSRPEIFVGGNSELAAGLAREHGDCLWRFPDTLDCLRASAKAAQPAQLGLLVSLIARPTSGEAWEVAHSLVERSGAGSAGVQQRFSERSDSVGFRNVYSRATQGSESWSAPCVWTGAVPFLGPPAIALVGSFEEVSEAILSYRDAGVRQFLFMGWPDTEEIEYFSQGVLPLVRSKELEAVPSA
jgi:alkanesulfonate monooxygenase